MSPSIHRDDKSQVSVWLTRAERQRLEEIVKATGAGTMTELIRRMIDKEHKRAVKEKKDADK